MVGAIAIFYPLYGSAVVAVCRQTGFDELVADQRM